ncbi:hypothetical protein PMIN01_10153 [Paraphaeosphaeria minitans]|uniref:Uncharacterized protein n=1 Tax=Paraphaeosphaeria minitans TaxID=565426 RepID=A0A9P6GB79_9PLEO|nr:hypothetical protein PMIN01_10153 [Paraphaeosphaeria minitans]
MPSNLTHSVDPDTFTTHASQKRGSWPCEMSALQSACAHLSARALPRRKPQLSATLRNSGFHSDGLRSR